MRLRYIKSACVLVECAGKRVLCDPWLTDGAYYGSWYHYPPLRVRPEDFSDVDALYISHVHPDHLDPATLTRLPRSIPVYILEYAERYVFHILKALGFQNVIEVPHGHAVELAPGFAMELLAADNCDPALCGKFFGCASPGTGKSYGVDSLAVFHGEGAVLVNVNDCPFELAKSVCARVLDKYRRVDMLLVGYSGAGPYPQCFENLTREQKERKAEEKKKNFLDQAASYIRTLKPSFFMPFAGQYTLGGRLASLNSLRGVPEIEEVGALFESRRRDAPFPGDMVLLDSGETFDLTSGKASRPFTPPSSSERKEYIDKVLSAKKYVYEDAQNVERTDWKDLTEPLAAAAAHMRTFQDRYGHRSEWTAYLDAGQEYLYRVPFDRGPVEKAARGTEKAPFVRVGLDYSLLNMILNKKAHWNNAEIGSHLRYFRAPDVFDRGVYHFMSYLHG
jgi:UDP-MurNAc hydroxylase